MLRANFQTRNGTDADFEENVSADFLQNDYGCITVSIRSVSGLHHSVFYVICPVQKLPE